MSGSSEEVFELFSRWFMDMSFIFDIYIYMAHIGIYILCLPRALISAQGYFY